MYTAAIDANNAYIGYTVILHCGCYMTHAHARARARTHLDSCQ